MYKEVHFWMIPSVDDIKQKQSSTRGEALREVNRKDKKIWAERAVISNLYIRVQVWQHVLQTAKRASEWNHRHPWRYWKHYGNCKWLSNRRQSAINIKREESRKNNCWKGSFCTYEEQIPHQQIYILSIVVDGEGLSKNFSFWTVSLDLDAMFKIKSLLYKDLILNSWGCRKSNQLLRHPHRCCVEPPPSMAEATP